MSESDFKNMKSNPKPRLRFIPWDMLKPLARDYWEGPSSSPHFPSAEFHLSLSVLSLLGT